MAYAFKVTVKNSYGKYVKGLTVQVVHASCSAPTTKEILQAFKDQLGIDINTRGYACIKRIPFVFVMKIIDKIIESISGCLSLIFWVIVALVCAGILALLS